MITGSDSVYKTLQLPSNQQHLWTYIPIDITFQRTSSRKFNMSKFSFVALIACAVVYVLCSRSAAAQVIGKGVLKNPSEYKSAKERGKELRISKCISFVTPSSLSRQMCGELQPDYVGRTSCQSAQSSVRQHNLLGRQHSWVAHVQSSGDTQGLQAARLYRHQSWIPRMLSAPLRLQQTHLSVLSLSIIVLKSCILFLLLFFFFWFLFIFYTTT